MDHRRSCSEAQDALVRRVSGERYEEDPEGGRDVMGKRRDGLKEDKAFRGTTRVPGTEEGRE